MASIICGVDVSGETLDGRVGLEGPAVQVSRTPEGIAQLRRFCADHGVELVVMEATGGYEKLPFSLLWAAGVACALVNPRSVRRFAEAMGFLEKTDRIDAGVMADYARVKRIVAQEPASESQERLRALVTRLRQLTELKVAQTNQRRLLEEAEAQAPSSDTPERASESGEIRARLRRALARLPPQAASVFVLRYLEGHENQEIARMLGLSRVAVAVSLHRTRRRLQRELQAFTRTSR